MQEPVEPAWSDDPNARHCIVHDRAPLVWHEGFPLGNGRLGVMVWGDGAPLCLTLDHADLWDLRANEAFLDHPEYSYAGLRRLVQEGRFDEAREVFEERERRDNPIGPTKLSIGRAELRIGAGKGGPWILDIDRAVVEGSLQTGDAERTFTLFAHHDLDVLCLRVTGGSGPDLESACQLIPLAQMTPEMASLGCPPPEVFQEDDVRGMVQGVPDGPCCAVAWSAEGPDCYIAVGLAADAQDAVAEAKATFERAREAGFDALLRQHLRHWRSFWGSSAVYLPERQMELLWYLGVYLLASSSRRGSCPPGLQGVWAMDGVMPPWRGDYHGDMNVQETFWPACCSGRLELLDTWCDHMKAMLPQAQAFTRRFFGTEGAFWPCATLPGLTSVPGWHTVEYAWSSTGWLAWLVWLRWRYGMDSRWLADTGYPLVAEAFRFYRANLERQDDGRLHIPLSSSPEYADNRPEAWCQDPAIDIALIRRCCDWVLEMEGALGLDDLSASARTVREELVGYPLTEAKVLCLWPGKPLDESHRHPSQLMAVHPAMDLTVEGTEEDRAIITASVEQFLSLGQYYWAGHTYAQMISLAAVVERPGLAYDCLRQFAEHWVGPNGLHFNADLALSGMSAYRYAPGAYGPFTFEANCGLAAGIGDMLVQGWNDRVRVFPAVAPHWRDVAFRDLLTEGAFRVSAIRRGGRTAWVRVVAGVDRRLRLRDPFEGAPVNAVCARIWREGEDILADLQAGQALTLVAEGQEAALGEALQAVRSSDPRRLGLR